MGQASHRARKKSASRRNRPIPGWLWLLTGLAIGLTIAFFTTSRNHVKQTPPPQTINSATPKQQPVPATSEASNSPKKNLGFYTALPKMEVIVPETYSKPGQAIPPGSYILQAGSFRSYEEADRLKAQIALLGIESRIEAVAVNTTETWHRVRVGPYQDLRELNKIRTRLLNNNISSVLIRING